MSDFLRGPRRRRSAGFSLVELLVALVFTGILMAGMSTVFRASLSAFVKEGEGISTVRRNRMALETLYDDLNSNGLQLTNMTDYFDNPALTTAAPGFYVTPNVSYANANLDSQGAVAGWNWPVDSADELYLYFDDALPYDGTLVTTGVAGSTAIQGTAAMIGGGSGGGGTVVATTTAVTNTTFNVQFDDPSYSDEIKQGMVAIFRDSWEAKSVDSFTTSGNTLTINTRISNAISGAATPKLFGQDSQDNAAGGSSKITSMGRTHLDGALVTMVNPQQQVRYSIQGLALDPEKATNLIPCLVRDQVRMGLPITDPSAIRTVIAENVVGLKAFVSTDRGATWAGLGYSSSTTNTSGDATPWGDVTASGKFRKVLDTGLAATATKGRSAFPDTSNPYWFREIPVLVRVDILTRTARKRSEYSTTNTTAKYGTKVQSFVVLPRHSGLPLG